MDALHNLREQLRKISFFADLDDHALGTVQDNVQLVTYEPEAILCREGDAGDRMFIIASGEVAVLKENQDKQPVEIALLKTGEIAGELSLFGRTVRSATLQARTPTTVWILDYETFQHVLNQNGTLAMMLLSRLSAQLRQRAETIARLLPSQVDHYAPTFWTDVEQMAKTHYCPRLTVYVVWHPDDQEGPILADHLYSRLRRDVQRPISRGLGIPVFFRHTLLPDTGSPVPIALDDAQHSAVVVLVDDHMVVDDTWGTYVAGLWHQIQAPNNPHRLFPVALTPQAFNMDSDVPEVNFIRAHTIEPQHRANMVTGSLIHELCRLLFNQSRSTASAVTPLSTAPVKLFISHAKRDGLEIAEAIRDYIHQNTALKTFFDASDIAAGYSFANEITSQLADSALLAIQTDAYVSREWCQREIITAKRLDRPIVVVNALYDGEERGFPYLGNVPTIRWHADQYHENHQARNQAIQSIIDLLLYEVLKDVYVAQHFEDLRSLLLVPERAALLSRPPELLSLVNLTNAQGHTHPEMVVYPDPPLGDEELNILTTIAPEIRFKTPTLLWREGIRVAPNILHSKLHTRTIGISISDSPDLTHLGLGAVHLQDAMVEFARYLLANNAKLAYGGDLREGGFTDLLFELVQTHNQSGLPPYERIHSFLTWPIHLQLGIEQKATLKKIACFHPSQPPADLHVNRAEFLPPDTPEHQYLWTRCLTAMRREMTQTTDARLLLGGRLTEYKGKYPGVVEEAYLTLQAQKPLFLIGGFGGASRAVIDALQGKPSVTLEETFQIESNPGYRELIACYNSRIQELPDRPEEPIDYSQLVQFFRECGMNGLNNGLSLSDNERLFSTPHIPEMISLVLKGLAELSNAAEF